jgi:hypothetical protein
MSTVYKIRIRNYDTGALEAEFTDFTDLAYQNVVNDVGICTFSVRGTHPARTYLVDKAIIEVYRKNDMYAIAWTRDFVGLLRDDDVTYVGKSLRMNVVVYGLNHFLEWRVNNWFTNFANVTIFDAKTAEYILKRIVEYNLAASATTANGRKRAGVIPNFATVAIGGVPYGTVLDRGNHGKPILGECQEIAITGAVDFNVVLTNYTPTFTFTTYNGQLGTDRSASVLFSMSRGNMTNPLLRRARAQEKTVATVWGIGEESAREYLTVTGDNYVSQDNDFEVYVDARQNQEGGNDFYTAKGAEKLKELKAVEEFTFDVLQTPSSVYGKHYFLGDIVSAEFEGVSATPKIVSAAVSFAGRKEVISLGLDNRYE